MKEILVTNDDGYRGKGLFPLIEALLPLGRVTVIVPGVDCSARSHAITIDHPVKVRKLIHASSPLNRYLLKKIGGRFFVADGTPADCVRLAYVRIIKSRIRLVASGINDGQNLGTDIIYSATVAAAREAAVDGIPSIAISSIAGKGIGGARYIQAQVVAYNICRRILKTKMPKGIYFNMNIPPGADINGAKIAIAGLGVREYGRRVIVRNLRAGVKSYTLLGEVKKTAGHRGSDVGFINKNFITLTPMLLDQQLGRSVKEDGKPWLKRLILPF